ncbi:hypothetical protein RJT34_03009 [Clitoria ternatea]|uniref:Uncharacterized protein n=1 Tax=Clitoria ternatea TaxID=43366 RepID=A0AAN9KI46_CLITE
MVDELVREMHQTAREKGEHQPTAGEGGDQAAAVGVGQPINQQPEAINQTEVVKQNVKKRKPNASETRKRSPTRLHFDRLPEVEGRSPEARLPSLRHRRFIILDDGNEDLCVIGLENCLGMELGLKFHNVFVANLYCSGICFVANDQNGSLFNCSMLKN